VRSLKLNVTFNFMPTERGARHGMEKAETGRSSRRRDPSECRCLCGSLVARRVPGGVELRCRRCKRIVVLPLDHGLPAASAPEANP
jgi:hypothetical protein